MWLLPRPTACQKDGRWKSGRRWIAQMNLLLNYITVTANIAGDLLEPAWIWDSPRKQSSLVTEKIMVWGYIQYGGVWEICRVEGNINSLKYQEVLAAAYIPNHKMGQILQQDGAPSHTSISSSSRWRRSRCSRIGQSPDMNIIEHVWGRMKEEAWKTKPKNLDELWEACKTAFFAIPDDFINKLYESLPNRMDAFLQAHGSHTRTFVLPKSDLSVFIKW